MPALTRISDIGEGECPTLLKNSTVEHGHYTTTFITGASTVFVNNLAQTIVGTVGEQDENCELSDEKGRHQEGNNQSQALAGSATVFVENQPVHRIGDTGQGAGGDTYTVLTGSPNVFNDDAAGGDAGPAVNEISDLPKEYSLAATAKVRAVAGRYAVFDDPPSISSTPRSYPKDTNAPPTKDTPTEKPVSTSPAETPVQGECNASETPNYNLALSPNFTLGKLSINALFSHSIKAQAGYSASQIICNLQALCKDVLEPINAQFPGLRINSGFRTFTKGTSQHEKGMACDIQWNGLSPKDYLPRAEWIVNNLVFDQFIFEHGNSIWLHVSFNRNSARQRKQVLTMINGSYQPGIKLYY